MLCSCGSERDFEACCGPCLSGARPAQTAEALMRARYVAYTLKDIDFLDRTTAPESRPLFDRRAAKRWASEATWTGLEVRKIEGGKAWDETGTVEFVARYLKKGKPTAHHEVSLFRKTGTGEWLYVNGSTGG